VKTITIFFGILAFCGAAMVYSYFGFSYEKGYGKLARAITVKTAEKLQQEKGLVLVGTGGGMMGDIQMMAMGFNFYQIVDIKTARTLLVDSVEEYLSDINANQEVRPFLHNYPFTAENIEIAIYFYISEGSNVPLDKITIAAAEQGKLVYYIDDPEKYTLKDIHEETYEEALRIVSLENSSDGECDRVPL
jgi:hypothetical protein